MPKWFFSAYQSNYHLFRNVQFHIRKSKTTTRTYKQISCAQLAPSPVDHVRFVRFAGKVTFIFEHINMHMMPTDTTPTFITRALCLVTYVKLFQLTIKVKSMAYKVLGLGWFL